MLECYHEDVEFHDPVFLDLKGWRAGAMWRMLVEKAKDLEIDFTVKDADENTGHAHWNAHYPFGKTGRMVHNSIDAAFEFKDGKIIKHRDTFSLWKWAGMALGLSGTFLGWTPSVQNKIRKESQTGLEMFIKRNKLGK